MDINRPTSRITKGTLKEKLAEVKKKTNNTENYLLFLDIMEKVSELEKRLIDLE